MLILEVVLVGSEKSTPKVSGVFKTYGLCKQTCGLHAFRENDRNHENNEDNSTAANRSRVLA